MINNLDFKPFVVTGTTAAIVVATSGHNSIIHTISPAKATAGTVTVANKNATTPVTLFTLPIGTLGPIILDCNFSDGLTFALSASADVVLVSGYQL